MTIDRLRWCTGCNLITASRKCPECRKDAYNVRLEGASEVYPIFKSEAARICSIVDSIYGDGCGELLFPDDRTALYARSSGSRQIIINGGIVGRITDKGDLSLNASGLSIIAPKISKNIIRCNHDSSFFITKGRNLMVTGVKGHSDGLKAGDVVAIFDRGRPIAEGVMRMSSEELDSLDRGVAVNVRSYESTRATANLKKYDWNATLESNKRIIEAFSGDSSKKISDVVSAYGYPVVVSLSTDILSEADLLLTLDAGYKPAVIVKKYDEFIDYLLNKHGLETVKELPEKCILISETHSLSDPGIIVHSPATDWDPAMIWLYVMMKAEPFHPSYMQNSL